MRRGEEFLARRCVLAGNCRKFRLPLLPLRLRVVACLALRLSPSFSHSRRSVARLAGSVHAAHTLSYSACGGSGLKGESKEYEKKRATVNEPELRWWRRRREEMMGACPWDVRVRALSLSLALLCGPLAVRLFSPTLALCPFLILCTRTHTNTHTHTQCSIYPASRSSLGATLCLPLCERVPPHSPGPLYWRVMCQEMVEERGGGEKRRA